ncbi:unnamed protein product [Linum trigynum]|uniref:Secreted protein n=1 Tax=Linum trigynum TaxID=586398 RepID=A0AAV2F4J4_9ROSI
MRWKRPAFLAASCILIVRAVVVQLAFFRRILIVRAVVVQLAFFRHMQDIPDLDGHKDFIIQSFTVKLGQEKVRFW